MKPPANIIYPKDISGPLPQFLEINFRNATVIGFFATAFLVFFGVLLIQAAYQAVDIQCGISQHGKDRI